MQTPYHATDSALPHEGFDRRGHGTGHAPVENPTYSC